MVAKEMQFADSFMSLLKALGFSHCFFLAGGNSMHLLEAARRNFKCVPFTHEVSAVIAAEYFNEISDKKAWVLVTAGPGLTNAVTGIAGAWLESRELLVVGGQVKSTDLAGDTGVRQRGIQEIDGLALTQSLTKVGIRVGHDTTFAELESCIRSAGEGRKGPVFIEIPLDISGSPISIEQSKIGSAPASPSFHRDKSNLSNEIETVISSLQGSKRPLFLIGQGLSKPLSKELSRILALKSVPVATSWTGADRVGFDFSNYVGRPNFFGMRASNVIIQQADLVVTLGARLGIQQTGFNRESFAPNAQIISVEIDSAECNVPFERPRLCINEDCEVLVPLLIDAISTLRIDVAPWLGHCHDVLKAFPLVEAPEPQSRKFINPYRLIHELGGLASDEEQIVPCSSGGTFTAFMQSFPNLSSQRIISNKGLASMGYGLAGAIGVALSNPHRRVLHLEGDGGFLQNLQELGTVSQQVLNLKMFVFDNAGYASIRTTQKRYFGGNYVGCDTHTGLGLPNWQAIAKAFDVDFVDLEVDSWKSQVRQALDNGQATLIRVPVDPEFQYLPKIVSSLLQDGTMVSNPLHVMEPPVSDEKQLGLIQRFL